MNPFEYASAKDAPQAISLLGSDGSSSLLAGGIDLLGLMKDSIVTPKRLVDIKGLRSRGKPGIWEAGTISGKGSRTVWIDALTRLSEAATDPILVDHFAALAQASAQVGSPQIRNVATVGGNLCQRPRCWYYRNENFHCLKKGGDTCFAEEGENKYHAVFGGGPCHIIHPSNLAPSLIAFDAMIEIEGAGGKRQIAASRFFVTPQENIAAETVLKPQEIVTGISIPVPSVRWSSAYVEAREKQDFDWPLASATVAIQWDGKRCKEARIVLGAVAPVPWRATAAEDALKGRTLDGGLAAAGEAATKGAEPMSHNGYKVRLVRALVKRAVRAAAGLEAEG